jgi:large subunit ribosomal protein L14
MIGMRTILEVADNSGARRLQCILPRGGDLGLRAGLGDIITASVKEAAPESAIKKGKVVRCVVVRMRKETRRKDGTYIRFDSNGEENSLSASKRSEDQAENQNPQRRHREGDRGQG